MRPINPDELVAIAELLGWEVDRQKGSHLILTRPGAARPLVIPNKHELAPFVLDNNLQGLGLSKKDLKKILRQPKRRWKTVVEKLSRRDETEINDGEGDEDAGGSAPPVPT